MENLQIKIPPYVSGWTDKYFHQSASDTPWNFPSQRVIVFLSKFKKDDKIKLFRGINKFNKDSLEISSWTYSKKIAKSYTEDKGKIIEKIFDPGKVILDTTLLNREQRMLLGYDYKVDNKEVLIFKSKI